MPLIVLSSLQKMQDFGVNLICVEDGIDSSKDAGKLMISVLSAVAEIERDNILVQTMEGRKQKAEKENQEEELLALQYQMNPHFLYNSLNSIRWMAMMTKNTKAADALVILSRIIEPVLRNPDFTWKLKDELDFLKDYIEMMSLRFDNCLEYQMECSEELYDEEFPRFVLQPIIETALSMAKAVIQQRV